MQKIVTQAIGTCIEDILYATSIIYGDPQPPYRALLQEREYTSERREEQNGRNLGHALFMVGIATTLMYTTK